MSLLEKRPKGRKSPPLIIDDDEIHDINTIVENYFLLNDSIIYYDTNLGSIYRSIYEKFTNSSINNDEGSTLMFDDSIDLNGIDSVRQLGVMKSTSTPHRAIFREFTDSFTLSPIKIERSNNNNFIIKTFDLGNDNEKDDEIDRYAFIDGTKDMQNRVLEKKIERLMLVIREIVMQLYGYYLNSIRPLTETETTVDTNLVIIPKIYYVQRKGDFIFVCMENIPSLQNEAEYLTYEKWNPIIQSVFRWFESQQLYHHDTAHRNVFLSSSGKLAVIDFGEAYVELPHMKQEHKTGFQPKGYLKTQTKDDFKRWITDAVPTVDSIGYSDIYGGMKRKKSIKKKTKKRRGKKGKKVSTRKKK